MKFVNMKLNILLPSIGVVLFLFGCSTLDPEHQSAQNAEPTENILQLKCGALTLEVQMGKLMPSQEEQVKEFKTRCRIDKVANQIELRHNLGDADRANPINIRPNPTNSGLPPDVGR